MHAHEIVSDANIHPIILQRPPSMLGMPRDWALNNIEPACLDYLAHEVAVSELADALLSMQAAEDRQPYAQEANVLLCDEPITLQQLEHSLPADLTQLLENLENNDNVVQQRKIENNDISQEHSFIYPEGVLEVREDLEVASVGKPDTQSYESDAFTHTADVIIESLEIAFVDKNAISRESDDVAQYSNMKVVANSVEIDNNAPEILIESLEIAFTNKNLVMELNADLEDFVPNSDVLNENILSMYESNIKFTDTIQTNETVTEIFESLEIARPEKISQNELDEVVLANAISYNTYETYIGQNVDLFAPNVPNDNLINSLVTLDYLDGMENDTYPLNESETFTNKTVQYSTESLAFLSVSGPNRIQSNAINENSTELCIKPEAISQNLTLSDILSFQQEVDRTIKTEHDEKFEEITLETRVCEVKTITMELTPYGRVTVEEKTQVQTDTDLKETKRSHHMEEALLTRKVTDTKAVEGLSAYPTLAGDITISNRSSMENLNIADTFNDETDNVRPNERRNTECQTITIEREPPLFIAVMAYEPDTDNSMPLHQGERVIVLDDTHKHWWLIKKIFSGREGFVPAEYLRDKYVYTALVDQMLRHNIEQLPSDTSKKSL